ncbi:hypothetical protein L211DRAFT_471489 [Terfezia boudieri ATCC MYA-4762]|uniref:Uncharacterized protein n=1 Tax=Terfezia boudieri ATCC MYA-4762 TaxID=1051890 RepID=A0A3N4M4Q2_9PEZI|nr:hypothetical protein L211DRAFT_471489 [Terfezia boudieri ATCC MYA-4762]
MGCFAKIKPLRTSAKDSKTGCCTIVKVMAFYIFGCSGCRKARKKVPKAIRRRFAASWQHEIELGTQLPLTPVESREPRPRLAEVQNAVERIDSKIWNENTQKYLSRSSRPPKAMKAAFKRESNDHAGPMEKAIRKNNVVDSPDSNAHSLTLNNSTPEEREWMFLAPESASHMRAIRQHGYTWFTKEGGRGAPEQVSRNQTARAAREEVEQREKESNGREKWNIRERVVLDGDYFRGTNVWEAFCMEKPEPSAQDPVLAEPAPENAREDNIRSVPEKENTVEPANIRNARKARNRSTSPHPPPLPVWPVASASTGTLVTVSSSSDSTPRFRRDSGDTTETELTIPGDSPLLKEAMESPLPVTPMTQSPILGPSVATMTLADYFPILTLPISDLPRSKATISDQKFPDSPVPESPVTRLSAETMTLMELLRNGKYAYKSHLAWEQWRAQRRSVLLSSEEQQVVLKEFGEQGPTYLPLPPIEPKRSTSVIRDWRPWSQPEKKLEVQKADLSLASSHEAEVVEIVAEEEEKAVSKLSRKLTRRKRKVKGKAKEVGEWEISPMIGFTRFRGDRSWEGEAEIPLWQLNRANLVSVEYLVEELSVANGGVGASCGRGTEEYERRKEGLGSWEPEEWEKKKKALDAVIAEGLRNVKGTREYQRAREYERIMKAEKERRERESKWTW